ncbi:hypothetical protein [Croceibacter atlanticus]|jgi:hypothetical protein|uniref:hypothetical protein n=1 Tax=Croceibacter atlanticus TaxID=313588 RepID=UPI0030D83781|tara:strand:- start:163823 stop:164623 length:801 start_codon:yes stop_codon:yes gene_type:complete
MGKFERDRFIAWIGHSNDNNIIWGQHERLFEFIFEEYSKTKRRFDEISIPTLAVLSHAIELGLKQNIQFFKQYHQSEHLSQFDDWNQLLKSHDLDKLSKEFKNGFLKLHTEVNALHKEKIEFLLYFKKFVLLINILSRHSETYRYAFKLDKNGAITKPSIERSKKIDFIKLKESFDKAKTLLVGASNIMGRYTDFIDYKNAHPEYIKGKGYLLVQKLHYSEHYLISLKEQLDSIFLRTEENKWFDTNTAENYEIEVWDKDIYIIAT